MREDYFRDISDREPATPFATEEMEVFSEEEQNNYE
jgi:hypothetical protein